MHRRRTPEAQGRHSPTTEAVRPTTTTPTTQPPVTPMVWSPCNGDLQCGTLVVPLDYADPDGPTIPIAVARHQAEDPAARIGSLVIDPGGPGVSGVDDMADELRSLTPAIARRFRHRPLRPPGRRAQRPGDLRSGNRQRAIGPRTGHAERAGRQASRA